MVRSVCALAIAMTTAATPATSAHEATFRNHIIRAPQTPASRQTIPIQREVNDGDIQWNGLRHDTFDSYYRAPFGAAPAGIASAPSRST
jgi:hypothetical protein